MAVAENIRKGCAAFYGENPNAEISSGSQVGEAKIIAGIYPYDPLVTAKKEAEATASWVKASTTTETIASGLMSSTSPVRTFTTGATRDTDKSKLDYEGFLSPAVLECYAEYMNTHRIQVDGSLRSSDNWQKGMPKDAYIKSGFRHFVDIWKLHRGLKAKDNHGDVTLENALCAMMFNLMGYLHEVLKEKSLTR